MDNHYVYIMASKKNGTLYIGVSGDLKRRVFEHKKTKSSKVLLKNMMLKTLSILNPSKINGQRRTEKEC